MNTLLKYILVVTGIFILASCTKKFEEYNTNPNGVTDEQANADYELLASQLKQAQRAIIYGPTDEWIYQLQQNLNGDMYSGYMSTPTPFNGNSNNLTYNLVDGWNERIVITAYESVMNPLYRAENYVKINPDQFKDVIALAKVIRVEAMHRLSDIFGPVIYTKYNVANAEGGVDYDSQEDAYTAFFKDLDDAVATLKTLSGSQASTVMTKADLAYGGSYVKWLKFANTLRLRLALRISKADLNKAKTEGEKALDPANGGIIESNSERFTVDLSIRNPLNTINNDWGDVRLGASIESIMGGYNDPRLPFYALPATDPAVAGQYKGIRTGINIDAKVRYENYSKLVTFSPKVQLLTAAEAWFLKAEAALKGWANAGNVQTNYETGIDRSFEQYGLNSTTYKNDAVSVPKPYIDPKAVTAGENNVNTGSPYLSTITIKWDNAASDARKLERIITQKWIAMFPEGGEAWAEYRRTGYPILFPVIVNMSAGKIPTIPGIRRLAIPQREYGNNNAAVLRATATLDGDDNGGTRLWWDKP